MTWWRPYRPSLTDRIFMFLIILVCLPFTLTWIGLEWLEKRGVRWPISIARALGWVIGALASLVGAIMTVLWVTRGASLGP